MAGVSVSVDGRPIMAEQGAPLLQAMLDAGLDIPHYCYHPKLTIDGSCRLCQVRIEGMPKLQISCNTPVREGMVVHTDEPDVAGARRGVLELLLLNHPLDCPICDKAGECWLQNYSMRFGSRFSRSDLPRRKAGKRMDIGARMLLDQERCVLCRRCVRFCREITHSDELRIYNLGDRSVLDLDPRRRLDNDYSICTADICPVGALESKDFHHRIRAWFLSETASVCPGCANGCNIMVSEYRNRIWRLLPRRNDEVNATWMCDHGRLNYGFVAAPERLRAPRIRGEGGLAEASWEQALARSADALSRFVGRHGGQALGAIISPHLTNEENFCFARMLDALGVRACAMAVRRGPSDNFLIKAEKAANARGVRELGLVAGDDDGMEALVNGIESGALRGLYLCGDDFIASPWAERLRPALAKLELLLAHNLTMRPEFAGATVLWPATTFAEKEGTFTNYAGRVQPILRALEPAPGWLNEGQIFTRLNGEISGAPARFDLVEIRQLLRRDHPRLANHDALSPAAGGASAGDLSERGLWPPK